MKRIMIIALLCFLITSSLVGLAWAQGEGEQQPAEQTQQTAEAVPAEPMKPFVDWGDYRYNFTAVAPSSDLDPQSPIMNWFTPDLYNNNWQSANYVHLKITIEWWNNDRSLDYMPVRLVLVDGGRRYILFGKANQNQSYLWRGGNQYGNALGQPNDLGCRYPDHLHDDAKLFFTFDTNGAAIDPNSAYIEVTGMLQVWDWDGYSLLYTGEADYYHYWYRYGSNYYTYTHMADIPLAQIMNGQ
jgi:hypothetical protein